MAENIHSEKWNIWAHIYDFSTALGDLSSWPQSLITTTHIAFSKSVQIHHVITQWSYLTLDPSNLGNNIPDTPIQQLSDLSTWPQNRIHHNRLYPAELDCPLRAISKIEWQDIWKPRHGAVFNSYHHHQLYIFDLHTHTIACHSREESDGLSQHGRFASQAQK